MSYIGKNPKVDSVKLTGASTAASGTEEGQLYYNTGTGSISKGLKVFKNSQFVAIDKQLGDADTMQLLKAADIPAIDFNLSVTSTTVGGNNAVPFESSTGDFDGTAAFSNSSTGDALLTDESNDLVFHYTTQATNSADNDFWGIPLTVPRAFRGGNLVLEFKYRTEIATGTMDDGYFNIAIQDRSAMILQTQASTISAGAIAAGSNVLLTGKTYSNPVTSTTLTVAVGDRVFVESGTGTAGSQTNDIVDCFITSVSSTDNNVTLSKDIVAVQSGKFVTGWLTGYDTGGQISAFASDTNKDGTFKKIQFKTDADTQQVSLWFFVKGTSTVKHELFFDNVLLSGNKFLQASSQTKTESYRFGGDDFFLDSTGSPTSAATDQWDKSLLVPGSGTPALAQSKLIQITDVSNDTRIIAREPITLSFSIMGYMAQGQLIKIHDFNDLMLISSQTPDNSSSAYQNATVEVTLAKNEYVYVRTDTRGNTFGSITITATSQTSPVVILESQDEIFTDWQEYTPTWHGSQSMTNQQVFWRRNGPSLEIKGRAQLGTVQAQSIGFSLPYGLSIDTSKLGGQGADDVFFQSRIIRVTNTVVFNEASGNSMGLFFDRSDSDSTTYLFAASTMSAVSGNCITNLNYNSAYSTSDGLDFYATGIPIKGWSANFNPLLSMPLVDFGTFSNTYTARFDGGATTSDSTRLLSESESFVKTVVEDPGDGRYIITFKDNFFSETPAVSACVENAENSDKVINVHSVTSALCKVSIESASDQAPSAANFNIIVTRQGSDFKPLPQPTAAVIKPSIARITYETARNANSGGSTGHAAGWTVRPLTTLTGEAYFVSINTSTDTFTLDPGMYQIRWKANGFSCEAFQTRLELDSAAYKYGSLNYSVSTGMATDSSYGDVTTTVTSSTQTWRLTQLNSHNNTTNGFGNSQNTWDAIQIHSEIVIEKLK